MKRQLFNCYLIGEDQLVLECAEIILSYNHLISGIISPHPNAEYFSATKKIPYFKTLNEAYSTLSTVPFDYLFSIVNGIHLPLSLLQKARHLSINYHNSLLPKYAGLHAPSWAILNNEVMHGITWHAMAEEIDAGDILKQAQIQIEPDETGLSLSVKCYQEALKTFKELVYDITLNQITPVAQNLMNRTYFDYYKKPRHGGWVSWQDSAKNIGRLCQALNLGHHGRNRLGLPKFHIGNDFFLISQARVINESSHEIPGTLIKITPDYWQIATRNQILQIEQVLPLHTARNDLDDIATQYGLTIGSCLPSEAEMTLLQYERIAEMYAIHELFWVKQATRFNPAMLPFQSLEPQVVKSNLKPIGYFDTTPIFQAFHDDSAENPGFYILAALFIYLYRLGNKERVGLGFSHPKLHQLPEKIAPLFSKIVPFSLTMNEELTVQEFLALFFKKISLIDKHITFANDIHHRYPELTPNLTSNYPITVIFGNEKELAKQIHTLQSPIVIAICDSSTINWYCREKNPALLHVIQNSLRHLPILLQAMLMQSTMPILKMPLLSQEERAQLLITWNQTQTDYPRDKNVMALFLEQVQKKPKKIALSYAGTHLSYQELYQKSNQIAQQLQQNGVKAGAHIVLFTDEKIALIIGLIAILRLGGTYIPIDTNYPAKHIQFILSDSHAALVLTTVSSRHKIQLCCENPNIPLFILDALLDAPTPEPSTHFEEAKPDDLAYIMYTSGTTGKPKGVMIPHRGINRLVKETNYIKITPQDRIAHAASIGFDAATFEIWGALLNGATLVPIPHSVLLSITDLSHFLIEEKISIMWLTSALFNEYASLNPAMFRKLTYLLVGGDVLNSEHIMNVLHCQEGAPKFILNGYGPTENTTFTTIYKIKAKKDSYQSIPIGKPIANTTVYLLDKFLQPLPIGAPGEIYTGGDGVALGYLNSPESTASRFIPNLYNNNLGLLYKTGDIARWMPDGTLDYLGREDHQIKIRGFRVELDAIYMALLRHESISQCAIRIVKNERQQKLIVAYIILNDECPLITIQRYMAANLPNYMVPAFFIKIDKIPLTLNGKVNFEQLPAPNFSSHFLRTDYKAPHSSTEKNIEKIWCDLFKISPIGTHDSFFDLGGHSLLITQLILKIKEQLGFNLPLQHFLEDPTIAHLAELIDTNHRTKTSTLSHWQFDTELNLLALPPKRQLPHAMPNAVLLTGANGFLGLNLLEQLFHLTSATIYCLIRGENTEDIKNKWEHSFAPDTPIKNSARIRLLAGDLEKSYLGLSIEQFMELADTIDIIYHNGAAVHHLYSYEQLRAANVLSIKEILKLATIKRKIPIHYVSALSAATNHTDNFNAIIEDFIYSHPNESPQGGYSQTKWVAEQLLAKAHQQQLPIKIYRPGWILGHSSTGMINAEKNHLLLLIKSCLQLGYAPDWNVFLDIFPVDQISQLIVKTSLNKKIPYNIFNLISPNKLAWSDLMTYLNQRGYRLSLCSPKQWKSILATKIAPNNALYSLLSLYINKNDNDWMNRIKISDANNQNTLHAFKENKMKLPLINDQLLNTYFNYLEQTGFLTWANSL